MVILHYTKFRKLFAILAVYFNIQRQANHANYGEEANKKSFYNWKRGVRLVKNKVKISALLIIYTFIVYLIGVTANNNRPFVFTTDRAAIQAASTDQFNRIYDSFMEGETIVYPDYFAGAYTNDEGLLTVLVTDDSESVIAELRRVSGNKKLIVLGPVEHSLSELYSLQGQITDAYLNYFAQNNVWKLISEVGIDEMSNRVVVGLVSLNETTKNDFLQALSVAIGRSSAELPISFEEIGYIDLRLGQPTEAPVEETIPSYRRPFR